MKVTTILPNKKTVRKFKILAKRWIFRTAILFIVIAGIGASYIFLTLPNASDLSARIVDESTKIYDREGGLLYEVHGEVKRTRVPLSQISDQVKWATVSAEDKNFYKHGGISVRGITRSVIKNLLALSKEQGGSTITQQLVKNALLGREKTWTRKIKEAILAVQVEARFSKDEILELYLNEVPYGRNAYGIEAAAQSYFKKHAKDLSLAESAYLAALPKAPSLYNPFGQNRKALDDRQKNILWAMEDQGYITAQEHDAAKESEVVFAPHGSFIKAAHFVAFIQDYLLDRYGDTTSRTGGLQVYTTIDPKMQMAAEKAIEAQTEKNIQKGGYNAGLVAIDPKTGQILAMVGSKNYFGEAEPSGCKAGDSCKFEPNFNVSLATRQPGSSFKPYAYAASFGEDFKFGPASTLMDVTTDFGSTGDGKRYVPQNYNGREYGPTTIRSALAGSLNIPAVKILAMVGVERVTETARSIGITSPMQNCGLSLVLGGCEVKLLDHTAGYATLANQGIKNPPTGILKIVDKNGNTIEEFENTESKVLNEAQAFLISDILRDQEARKFIFGANSNLIIPGHTTAVKTGTTQNWRDGWTLGYTPSLAAGVWVGNNDGSFMKPGADGSVVAAPIWKNFMVEALKDMPEEPFKQPQNVDRVEVDALSGLLPGPYTENTKTDFFAQYSIPKKVDDTHIKITIDTRTGQQADNQTPEEFKSIKSYTILHSEKPNNTSWESPVRKWALEHNYNYPPNEIIPEQQINNDGGQEILSVQIINPQDNLQTQNTNLPIQISGKGSKLNKLEVFINGVSVKITKNAPFEINFNYTFPEGNHIIAARATDSDNQTVDTTVHITITNELFTQNTATTLTLLEPQTTDEGDVILTAESSKPLETVGFYAITQKNGLTRTKLLGIANPKKQNTTSYDYQFIWPVISGGPIILYAKSGEIISNQKTIIIP